MQNHFKQIVILFITLFLVMMGFGIIIPILPFFVTELGGSPIILGLFMASFSLMQFIFAPIWGRISDRIGRRPVLLIGLGGYGITFILFGLSTHLWMLFAVRILSGIISSATLPTAMAYVADITDGDDRSQGMGWLGAAMGMGMVFGPALGGLLGHHGYALPFFAAGGLAMLTFPFSFFMLPESLKEPQTYEKSTQAYPLKDVVKHPLFVLFALAFVSNFALSMFQGTYALYSAEKAGFGPGQLGIVFTFLGASGAILQGGFMGILVKHFGDNRLIVFGLLLSSAGMLSLLLNGHMLVYIITPVIFNAGLALVGPCSSTLVTRNSIEGQGRSLGFMQSANSLGRIIGPLIGGFMYDVNIHIPYIVGAIGLLLFTLIAGKRILNGTNGDSSHSVQSQV